MKADSYSDSSVDRPASWPLQPSDQRASLPVCISVAWSICLTAHLYPHAEHLVSHSSCQSIIPLACLMSTCSHKAGVVPCFVWLYCQNTNKEACLFFSFFFALLFFQCLLWKQAGEKQWNWRCWDPVNLNSTAVWKISSLPRVKERQGNINPNFFLLFWVNDPD